MDCFGGRFSLETRQVFPLRQDNKPTSPFPLPIHNFLNHVAMPLKSATLIALAFVSLLFLADVVNLVACCALETDPRPFLSYFPLVARPLASGGLSLFLWTMYVKQ